MTGSIRLSTTNLLGFHVTLLNKRQRRGIVPAA
jgi:hypothetical protein